MTENIQGNTVTQVPCLGFLRCLHHLGSPDKFTPRHTKHGKQLQLIVCALKQLPEARKDLAVHYSVIISTALTGLSSVLSGEVFCPCSVAIVPTPPPHCVRQTKWGTWPLQQAKLLFGLDFLFNLFK